MGQGSTLRLLKTYEHWSPRPSLVKGLRVRRTKVHEAVLTVKIAKTVQQLLKSYYLSTQMQTPIDLLFGTPKQENADVFPRFQRWMCQTGYPSARRICFEQAGFGAFASLPCWPPYRLKNRMANVLKTSRVHSSMRRSTSYDGIHTLACVGAMIAWPEMIWFKVWGESGIGEWLRKC